MFFKVFFGSCTEKRTHFDTPFGVLCDLRFRAAPKPPLCKGRWHGVSRDGGIVMQPKHNRQLLSLAKQLRKEMTKEERHLWYDFLRSYPVRFSRQKVLGKYIADFYCAEAKLVFEMMEHNLSTKYLWVSMLSIFTLRL